MNFDSDPDVSIWFDESIEKVRVSSTPGGNAFDAEEARELHEELDAAIEAAEKIEDDDGETITDDEGNEVPRRSEPADFGGGESTGVQDL